jgi:hypothetical protein
MSSRSPFLATELTNMTNQHPITPPPELRCEWLSESPFKVISVEREDYMIDRAAQWGADTELEACCEVLARELICDGKHVSTDLRMIRRPKPPSLKEQALIHFESFAAAFETSGGDSDLIRRALEALPE